MYFFKTEINGLHLYYAFLVLSALDNTSQHSPRDQTTDLLISGRLLCLLIHSQSLKLISCLLFTVIAVYGVAKIGIKITELQPETCRTERAPLLVTQQRVCYRFDSPLLISVFFQLNSTHCFTWRVWVDLVFFSDPHTLSYSSLYKS